MQIGLRIFLPLWSAMVTGTFISAAAAAAAAGPADAVIDGLEVRPASGGIVVSPGRARVGGESVEVRDSVFLAPRPQVPLDIRKERYASVSPALPVKWEPGTHLLQTISPGGTSFPGALEPGSVLVELPDGTKLDEGRDFDVNTTWGAVSRREGGRLSTDTEALISYRVGRMRLDTVEISPDGRVSLIEGVASKDTAEAPASTTGSLPLARVFMPYHATATIQPWQIFKIGEPFPEPGAAEMRRRAKLVPRTHEKLRRGEPVTVVTWGDSVTAGGDASAPEKRFADSFVARLRERFPAARITHRNAGIGATNTDHRLPGLKKEVLDFKPDLVTIEFINDMTFAEPHYRRNYDSAIAQIRDAGAEIILITPHFAMPEMMGHEHPRGKETRPAVTWLRDIAAEKNVGLADTSRRWEHLETEGIPYVTWLANGINHPDDRGHELFVKDLLTFFPAEGKPD